MLEQWWQLMVSICHQGFDKSTILDFLQNLTNICVLNRRVEKYAGSTGQHNVGQQRHHCSQQQQSGGRDDQRLGQVHHTIWLGGLAKKTLYYKALTFHLKWTQVNGHGWEEEGACWRKSKEEKFSDVGVGCSILAAQCWGETVFCQVCQQY